MKKAIISLLFAVICSFCFSQETGKFQDPRDGKIYKTVKINNLTFIAENFAYRPATGNFWIFQDDTANLAKFGYLYDWETARTIAPTGWHLPTKEEYQELVNFLIKDTKNRNKQMEVVYSAIAGENGSGFNVVFGGFRLANGQYSLPGKSASFWSSSQSDKFRAFILRAETPMKYGLITSDLKKMGFSVRLIKD